MASDERTAPGTTTPTQDETAPTANGAATRPKSGAPKSTKPAGPKAAQAGATSNLVHRRRAERRPEMIAKRREERFKQFEQRKKQWFYTKIAAGVGVGLIAIALGFAAWGAIQDRIDENKLDDVVTYGYSNSEQHVEEPVSYTESPPVGGPHNPIFQSCGFYEDPIANENGVHTLEHGAVWITFQPDLPAEQVAELKAIADSQSFILVSPYPGLPTPVVVSSWNHQLQLQSADEERLEMFIRQYKQNPDTTPEMVSSCAGGNMTTNPA
jgi:hypothetical protein